MSSEKLEKDLTLAADPPHKINMALEMFDVGELKLVAADHKPVYRGFIHWLCCALGISQPTHYELSFYFQYKQERN